VSSYMDTSVTGALAVAGLERSVRGGSACTGRVQGALRRETFGRSIAQLRGVRRRTAPGRDVLLELSSSAQAGFRWGCQTHVVLNIYRQVTPEGYVVCRPVGELDAFTISRFRQALADLASSGCLVIDLSGVPFVDSAGLGALIGGIRHTRELGGQVAVACSRPTLVRLLCSTGFDRVVDISDTVAAAAAALRAAELNIQVAVEA
jgi:anti-sigma B factor antagonist